MAGYVRLPVGPYLLGLAVVALPAFLLEERGRGGWAWRYAWLIILMLLVVNYQGVSKFGVYLSHWRKGYN